MPVLLYYKTSRKVNKTSPGRRSMRWP